MRYYYLQQNGQEVPLSAWQVHHRRAMVLDGLTGISPLRVAMLAVALGMATEEFGARFFAQGARPGFPLSHPGQLTDKAYERLKGAWNSETLENAHKVRIIEEGMKVEAGDPTRSAFPGPPGTNRHGLPRSRWGPALPGTRGCEVNVAAE